MNILKYITGVVTIEGMGIQPIAEGWIGVSVFLFLLLTFLVITTTYKSKKMKELKQEIEELEKIIIYVKSELGKFQTNPINIELKGGGNMMEDKTKKLASAYISAERELLNHLHNLENDGCECNCGDREIIRVVYDEGDFPEISTYCLNCGGYVD